MISRRDFARAAGWTAVATSLASCASIPALAVPPGSRGSFASLKQVDAGALNVGYTEDGPPDGGPVILLHGWPYDIHSYVDVAPLLAARGYRVLVPYLRGYGSTQFLSADTVRNGQQAALAQDIVAFMDALSIQRALLGGFDWGARTADIAAALWPERVKALVSVSGYLIVDPVANQRPLSPQAEHGWWYQYYFATQRGVDGYRENTHDFNKLIWQEASPLWKFDDATYDRTATAFKRYMGTNKTFQLGKKSFRAEELSALILRSLKADAERFLEEGEARFADDRRPRMFGEDALWLYKRGAARAGLGRVSQAEQDLEKSVSLEGRPWVRGRARLEMGKLALKAGDRPRANTELRAAFELCESDNDGEFSAEAQRLLKMK